MLAPRITREITQTGEVKEMKVLAINNGRDRTACIVMETVKGTKFRVASGFLSGNIAENIKALCKDYSPDKVVLQLPPTGLDKKTQKAIQEGFGRNVAAAFNLNRYPVIKNLIRTRASLGCYTREQARQFCEDVLSWDHVKRLSRRHQMQLINTLMLARDSVEAVDSEMP